MSYLVHLQQLGHLAINYFVEYEYEMDSDSHKQLFSKKYFAFFLFPMLQQSASLDMSAY